MTKKQRLHASAPLHPSRKASLLTIVSDQRANAIDTRRQIREAFHDSKARVIQGGR